MSALIVNDTILSNNNSLSESINTGNSYNSKIELKCIEEKINSLLNNQKNNDEAIRLDAFKNIFTGLQCQINALTDEINILREESKNKSTIITNLIDIIKITLSKNNTDSKTIKEQNASKLNVFTHNITITQGNVCNTNEILKDLNSTPIPTYPIPINQINPINKPDQPQYYQFPPITEENTCANLFENISSGDECDSMFKSTGESNKTVENTSILNSIYDNPMDEKAMWKPGTTLITGDSMLYGIDETRLKHSKVRIFPGCTVDDMFYNIFPLLRKKPSNILLHVGTNNAVSDTPEKIVEKLNKLKKFYTIYTSEL